MWLYGFGLGFLIVLIRGFGVWPDAVPFAWLERVVRAGFRHRRKRLRSNLVHALACDGEAVDAALVEVGAGVDARAEELAPAWRADRYRLFSDPVGEHLVWICRWDTPEAATKAARLIQATLSPRPDDPAYGTESRHTRVAANGETLLFINCADQQTLQSLLPLNNQ